MTRASDMIAGSALDVLLEHHGEEVTYTRYTSDQGSTVATGFPITPTVVFEVVGADERNYDSGQAEVEQATVHIPVASVAAPQIDNDVIARGGHDWTVREIINAGSAITTARVSRFTAVRRGNRDMEREF